VGRDRSSVFGELSLPPGILLSRHVDQKFNAMEANSLCTLDGDGEEDDAYDLCHKRSFRNWGVIRCHVNMDAVDILRICIIGNIPSRGKPLC
jgi:hypothetical protein